MNDVLGMGGQYMFSKYKQAAKQFCATKWHHTWTRLFVLCLFTKRKSSLLAADCDHLLVSLITDIQLRFLQGSYPNSDVERLQTQCFKSVWVATALHQVRRSESVRSDYWPDHSSDYWSESYSQPVSESSKPRAWRSHSTTATWRQHPTQSTGR